MSKIKTILDDIEDIVNKEINDMFARVQDIIEVHDGDFATHFYVDKKEDIESPLVEMLRDYASQEITFKMENE